MSPPQNHDECNKHDRVKHNADERAKQLQNPDAAHVSGTNGKSTKPPTLP